MKLIDKLSWVALTAINGVGTQTILRLHHYLTKHDSSWEEFWVLKRDGLTNIGLSEKLIDRIISFRKEHTIYSYSEWLSIKNISVLIKGDDQYPPLLARLAYSPMVLFTKGKKFSWNEQPVVAVVGTRQITAYGHLVTAKICKELSNLGAMIVSGFMYGVDVTAHASCLEAGGETTAVLGYGFEYCYPSHQQGLMNDFLDKGAIFITPFAPHVAPKKGQFVARNRLVAGMSHAVVVTEAAQKSGSHITAGYAADENKVVCAVPGPITNPYSVGTQALINQGAVLIQSGKEVLEECGQDLLAAQHAHHPQEISADVSPIMAVLTTGAFTIEELMNICKLQYTAVTTQITALELAGKVKKEGSRWNLTN